MQIRCNCGIDGKKKNWDYLMIRSSKITIFEKRGVGILRDETDMEPIRKRRFEVLGQDAYYEEVMPWLEVLFDKYLQDEDEHYLIAVNEAVCNAARYAKAGPDAVRIIIDLKIAATYISTTIGADTEDFDVEAFVSKMRSYAEDPKMRGVEWGEFTGNTKKSRGFWFMLMGCRKVEIAISGKKVTLIADRPFLPSHVTKCIGELVKRLCIGKEEPLCVQ